MKKIRKIFPVMLFIVLLTSCGTAEKTVTYQYQEKKTVRQEEAYLEEYGTPFDTCAAEMGVSYSLYRKIDMQTQEKLFTVMKTEPESNTSEVVPLDLDENVTYLFVRAGTSGEILLNDSTTLYVYSMETGECIQSFQAWGAGGMVVTEDNCVICQTGKETPYYKFSLSTGENRGIYLEEAFLFEQGNNQPFLDGTFGQELLVTSAGIYEHAQEEWKLLVPSGRTSMSKAGFSPRQVIKGSDDTYLMSDTNYLYTYSLVEKDTTAEEEPVTLKVTAWQNGDTLRTALTEYQISHPNVTIEYTYRCNEMPETEQEASTLIQKTNAEIVSSEAADIYVLDCLPWEQYQEKGLFMDISDIVKPYAEDENYFGNILTAYETEQEQYVVPWFFTVNFIFCEKELEPYVKSINALAGYLKEHPEDLGLVPYYYQNRQEMFLAMMYDFYGNDLYEDGMVTRESVTNFLSSAKIIYDRLQENTSATVLDESQWKYIDYSFVCEKGVLEMFPLLMEEQQGSVVLMPITEFGLRYSLMTHNFQDYTMVPTKEIHTSYLFGIHSQSREKEAAAELLNYLLHYFEEFGWADESLRSSDGYPGLPIYQPYTLAQLELQAASTAEDNPYGIEPDSRFDSTHQDIENLMALVASGQEPGYNANAIVDDTYAILEERTKGYLTGERTIEQVADDVYNGLMLLYEENQ